MRGKLLFSLLVIALAGTLVAGAMGAWFTDDVELPKAEFTAGTLEIDVDKEPVIKMLEGRYVDNVNPGDCATVSWDITNMGTKSAELRVRIKTEWQFADGQEPGEEGQVAFFSPKQDSGWEMIPDEDGGMWLYYTGGPVPGTYNPENPEAPNDPAKVTLSLVVGFDGDEMDDDYQGAKYIISGDIYAVQSTNGAPAAVWGGEFWNKVENKEFYEEKYFTEGPGKDMECWKGEEDPIEDPEPDNNVADLK